MSNDSLEEKLHYLSGRIHLLGGITQELEQEKKNLLQEHQQQRVQMQKKHEVAKQKLEAMILRLKSLESR